LNTPSQPLSSSGSSAALFQQQQATTSNGNTGGNASETTTSSVTTTIEAACGTVAINCGGGGVGDKRNKISESNASSKSKVCINI